MAKIEIREIARVLHAFAGAQEEGERFFISNKSLDLLADYVARRLNANPNSLNALVVQARAVRQQRTGAEFNVVIHNGNSVPALFELDAAEIIKDCFDGDSYPELD